MKIHMAQVIPKNWRQLTALGTLQPELEPRAVLVDGSPDTYAVYPQWSLTLGQKLKESPRFC